MCYQSCLWLTLPDSHLQCITNQFCFHSCTHTPADHRQITQGSQGRKSGDNNGRWGTDETCNYSGLKGREGMRWWRAHLLIFYRDVLCTVIPYKIVVNGGIIKPHAHKGRDDYQNEEKILLLVQFPLLLFWWAYSPEWNFCSSMKTVVDPHFSAHRLDSNRQTKISEQPAYVSTTSIWMIIQIQDPGCWYISHPHSHRNKQIILPLLVDWDQLQTQQNAWNLIFEISKELFFSWSR